MRPHRAPEGDHSEFMDQRRKTAPFLFNAHGSYRNWLHVFSVQRDRSGASINNNSHFVLPWELEDTTITPNTYADLKAHQSLHGFRYWHPNWKHFDRAYSYHQDAGMDAQRMFWVLLPDPAISVLAQWLLNVKKQIRTNTLTHYLGIPLKEEVEAALTQYRIHVPNNLGEINAST